MFCLRTSAIKRSPKRAINVHIMSLPSQLLLCFGAIWNGFSVAFVLRQVEQTILLKFPNNQFNSRYRKASVTEKVLGLCHWKWLENGRKILVVKRERESCQHPNFASHLSIHSNGFALFCCWWKWKKAHQIPQNGSAEGCQHPNSSQWHFVTKIGLQSSKITFFLLDSWNKLLF